MTAKGGYVLIIAPDSWNKGTRIHYKERRGDHRMIPLCRTGGWEELRWIKDPVQGLGADICGRCISTAAAHKQARREAYLARERARQARYRQTKREELLERNRQYRADTNQSEYRKRRYHNDPEYRAKVIATNVASKRRRREARRLAESQAEGVDDRMTG